MNLNLPGLILALKVVSFLIASWLLVHLMAVFGIFLVFAYPIWRILLPQRTPCLYCRLTSKNKSCSHKNIVQMILTNSLILLAITIISFGLVFLESRLLFRLGFPPTPKTVSFVIPSQGQYRLGEIFPLKIEITNVKRPVNAVQADLAFDPARLQIIDISTAQSFADIFIQKEINNDAGYTRLSGGLADPGFFATRGLFGTVFFQGKSPGIVTVEFLPTSMVLANDGRGTNTIKDFSTISYLILPEALTPEESELQKNIYLEKTILGQATDDQDTQLHLYPEQIDSQILGATSLKKEIEQSQKFNIFRFLLDLLETVDRFILNFWHRILNLLHLHSLEPEDQISL